MAAGEIAIVSDDFPLLALLESEFKACGFSLRRHRALDGLPQGLNAAPPLLLIIDLDVSEEPPWDQVASIRADPGAGRLPLIFVSGRHTAHRHVISGLRLGAAEYVAKPCAPKVFVARVQALLSAIERRKKRPQFPTLNKTGDGKLSLDLKAHRCLAYDSSAQGREIALAPKEFLILSILMARQNELVSKEELLRATWPMGAGKENLLTLAQHISHLRRKLGPFGAKLRTVWGLGYRFEG